MQQLEEHDQVEAPAPGDVVQLAAGLARTRARRIAIAEGTLARMLARPQLGADGTLRADVLLLDGLHAGRVVSVHPAAIRPAEGPPEPPAARRRRRAIWKRMFSG